MAKIPARLGWDWRASSAALKPLSLTPSPGSFGDDFDSSGAAAGVVFLDDFFEAGDAHDAGFGGFVIEDGDFAAGSIEGFNHGFTGEAAALVIVGRDVGDDFDAGSLAFDVEGEDRDAGVVGVCDDGADRLGVAGIDGDGVDLLDDEVFDLVGLLGGVLVAGEEDDLETVLGGFFGHDVP